MKQTLIAGIDEVGRGPWAGPVAAAAVIMPPGRKLYGLRDSKQLNRVQRQKLSIKIKQRALGVGIGWVSHSEIDSLGLTEATRRAMLAAIKSLSPVYQEIIIDGSYNFLREEIPQAQTLIKADGLIPSVMAASVIAKVARDDFMCRLAQIYEDYGFESHVGYGTPAHRDCLNKLGPSPIHRMSFKPLWGQVGVN